jgi:hypothetical protein
MRIAHFRTADRSWVSRVGSSSGLALANGRHERVVLLGGWSRDRPLTFWQVVCSDILLVIVERPSRRAWFRRVRAVVAERTHCSGRTSEHVVGESR